MTKTLIFLPGGGYKANIWDKVIQNLGENYNTVKIDLPEYKSEWNKIPMDIMAMLIG